MNELHVLKEELEQEVEVIQINMEIAETSDQLDKQRRIVMETQLEVVENILNRVYELMGESGMKKDEYPILERREEVRLYTCGHCTLDFLESEWNEATIEEKEGEPVFILPYALQDRKYTVFCPSCRVESSTWRIAHSPVDEAIVKDRKFDPPMADKIADQVGADCGNCFSTNIQILGSYASDEHGIYVDFKCHQCGKIGEVGDGEFWDHYERGDDGEIYAIDFEEEDLVKSSITVEGFREEYIRNAIGYMYEFGEQSVKYGEELTEIEEELGGMAAIHKMYEDAEATKGTPLQEDILWAISRALVDTIEHMALDEVDEGANTFCHSPRDFDPASEKLIITAELEYECWDEPIYAEMTWDIFKDDKKLEAFILEIDRQIQRNVENEKKQ